MSYDENKDTIKIISKSIINFNFLKDYLYDQGFERRDLKHLTKAEYENTIDMFVFRLFGARIEITCFIESYGELFYECVCYKNENDIFLDGVKPKRYYSVEEVMNWIKDKIKKIVSAENAKD